MFVCAKKQAAVKSELEELYAQFPTAARVDAGTLAAVEAMGLTFDFETGRLAPLDEKARYGLKMYS